MLHKATFYGTSICFENEECSSKFSNGWVQEKFLHYFYFLFFVLKIKNRYIKYTPIPENFMRVAYTGICNLIIAYIIGQVGYVSCLVTRLLDAMYDKNLV